MSQKTGKFTIISTGAEPAESTIEKDGIFIGRLDTCEIVLNHKAVSRIHAGINFRDSKYFLVNLTSSNVLTVNGRLLGPQRDDVLAGGDTIQIGPFTILVAKQGNAISLTVQGQVADRLVDTPEKAPDKKKVDVPDVGDVLKVFWEKRTRDKEDWGTRLRPTEKPMPGKAMFNWRPTRDLKRPWRFGLFVWAFLLISAVGVFAFFRYPGVYSPKPIANPHAITVENSTIAIASNSNSCTTCHTPNEPVENACIKCHQGASEFHVSNTKAHAEAGISCNVCHKEHQGADFNMTASAIQSCAECHNDSNKNTYNGKTVHTAHGGSYGYPIENGEWKWKGVYREVADAIPEIKSSATGDRNEQTKLSRFFHTIHVGRLKAPEGIKGDKFGLVSCSSCHDTTGRNTDRLKPRQTCAVCHTTSADAANRDTRFGNAASNCISCHVQHTYSGRRWSEFMTEDALKRRVDAVSNKIKELNGQ